MLDNYKEQLPPSGEETDKIDYNQQLLEFENATSKIDLNENTIFFEEEDLSRYKIRYEKDIDNLVSELPSILNTLDTISKNLNNLSSQEKGKKPEDQDNALLVNIQNLMEKIKNTANKIYEYIGTYNNKKAKNSPTNKLMNKSDKKDISTTKEVIDEYRNAPKFEGEAVKYLLEYGKIPTSKQLQKKIDKQTMYLTEDSILRELHQFWNEIRSCDCGDTEVKNALGDAKIGKEIFDTLMDKLGPKGAEIITMPINNLCYVIDSGAGAPLINTKIKLRGATSGGSREGGSREGGSREGGSREGGSREGGSREGGSRVDNAEFSNDFPGFFVQNPSGDNLQYVEYKKGKFIVRDAIIFNKTHTAQEFINEVSRQQTTEKTRGEKFDETINKINKGLEIPAQIITSGLAARNVVGHVIRTCREIVSTPIEQEVSNQNNNDYHDDQP